MRSSPRLLTPPSNNAEVEQTAIAVSSVKKIMSFVTAVSESLQETLTYLTSVKSPGWGLLSLPGELIGNIIELAVYGDRTEIDLSALQLSHVCRRFRDVAIHLPVIWTDLSCRSHGHALVGLYAERSNGLGLNICSNDRYLDSRNPHPHDPYKPGACARFFQAIVPYCEEWRSLLSLGTHFEHSALQADLRLPRLEHLQVCWDRKNTFERYDMPNLKSALLVEIIPRRAFAPTLTSLTILLEYPSPAGISLEDCNSLLKFLEATPLLVDLGIKLCCHTDGEDLLALPSVTLGNVETFRLDVVNPYHRGSHHRHLVKPIKMPNLSSMDLRVTWNDELSSPPLGEEVFGHLPDPALHSKLSHFRLTTTFKDGFWTRYEKTNPDLINSDGSRFGFILTFDVSKAPFLTSLTLQTNFEIRLVGTEFFPLRRLQLENCRRISKDLFEDLRNDLERSHQWETFEGATLYNCEKFPRGQKRLQMMGGKMRVLRVTKAPRKPMGFEGIRGTKGSSFWELP